MTPLRPLLICTPLLLTSAVFATDYAAFCDVGDYALVEGPSVSANQGVMTIRIGITTSGGPTNLPPEITEQLIEYYEDTFKLDSPSHGSSLLCHPGLCGPADLRAV
jgi:hypothetical protein